MDEYYGWTTFFCKFDYFRILKVTLWKTHFFGIWGIVLGLWCSNRHTNFEKSLYRIFRMRCISESTLPTVTKRVSQFRRPLLRKNGVHLNITSHFPTPLQSEHSYYFGDQRTSSFLRSEEVRQLSSRTTIPFSSKLRFNMDFRESRPKFLSSNSSQPWPR